ncbi:MAG: hypothetical protein ACKOYM_00925, partial [Actinomycetes bacterium]
APQPLVGTVVRHQLFSALSEDRAWGESALLDPTDGVVYAYSCDEDPPLPGSTLPPERTGSCGLASVPLADVTDRSAWRYWSGSAGWVDDAAAATALDLPPGLDGVEIPRASFTVSFDPVHHVYVMAYTPWPGIVGRLQVRVATLPSGPWTAPVDVQLPGCSDQVAGVSFYCYAGTAQPAFSGDGLLGLGYYDQLLSLSGAGGGYIVVEVPFTVLVTI